jgi:hypothetical protein
VPLLAGLKRTLCGLTRTLMSSPHRSAESGRLSPRGVSVARGRGLTCSDTAGDAGASPRRRSARQAIEDSVKIRSFQNLGDWCLKTREDSMKLMACLVLVVLASSSPATQVPSGRRVGLVAYLQAGQTGLARDLLAAAEKMPEGDYGFKPTTMDEARTYAAVIGHTADGMFGACARARGVAHPDPGSEKALTSKGDLVTSLAAAIAFCEPAFSGLTDENAGDFVRQGPVEVPRIAALVGVIAHNAEMYGITTVYLRARNLVPPASERR